MVSRMMAVLPVWRSPMTSSRWPRPTGMSASMAFRPVAMGSCTDLRGMMPGAFTSTRRRSAPLMGSPRGIDHAAAELDDQPANDRRVDAHVDIDLLLGGGFERVLQRRQVLVRQFLGDRDLRSDLAFVARHQGAIGLHHVAHREQAP